MTRGAKIWSLTGVWSLAWGSIAWYLPQWLGLSGTPRWIVLGVMAVVGLVAGVFTAVFLARRPPAPPAPKDPLSQEVEASLTQSERRLLDARLVKGKPLQRLPVIFVLGGREQGKTATVIKSGAQAELLAGDVLRGMQINPTEAVNIWLSRPALLVEAGPDVLADAQRRDRLFHRLQPARLADAVTRGEQAPRAAIVCQTLKSLNNPGEAVTTARELRQHLAQLSHLYGVRLPVYVVFTKADEVPGFKEYAKTLTGDEAREVVGVTLPLAGEMSASTYADAARQRIRSTFNTLLRSLGERRHLLLARGGDEAERAPAYQFPKELKRLEGTLSEYLIELVRPSELQVNPLLRGFYLSGVRETLVSGGGPVAADPVPAALDAGGGATSLLKPLAKPGPAAMPAMGGPAAVRRQAQWVFLDRLFSGVVLDDPVAFRLTRGGARVSYFRRMALGTVLGAAALVLIAVSVSFGRNAALVGRFKDAARQAAAIPAESVPQPTREQLVALDSLGAVLDVVSDHANGGAPTSYRWGLSQGARLYPGVRTEYFKRFGALLYAPTRDRMIAQLRGTPPGPLGGATYEAVYRRLKTHLIGTSAYHDSSTVEYVAPTMLADWPGAASSDTGVRAVALRQFERYARELRYHDLYGQKADDQGVSVARTTLNQSSGVEPIYQAMVAEASTRVAPLALGRTMSALNVPVTIPGAYTAKGWDAVHASLRNIKRFLTREIWVIGPEARPLDITEDSLVVALRARFDTDYTEQWRALVRNTSVRGFGNLSDAAARLTALASSSSEILQLFAIVNENVPDDSQRVARAFTTIGSLGQPKMGPSLGTDATKPYMEALAGLATKVGFAATVVDRAQGKPQYMDAQAAAGMVSQQVQAIGRPLDRTEWETLGLGRLLDQPARYATALLSGAITAADRAAGAGAAEEQGQAFCGTFGPMAGSFPFTNSREQMSPQELAGIVGPSGSLPALAKAVREAGPSEEGRTFLERLDRIRVALYPGGGNEAQIRFQIAPDGTDQRRVLQVNAGGRTETWQPGESDLRTITWRPAIDQTLSLGEQGETQSQFDGAWAPLALFRSVEGWTADGNGYRFRTDQRIGYRVSMSAAVRSLLRGDVFDGMRCPAKWTRQP